MTQRNDFINKLNELKDIYTDQYLIKEIKKIIESVKANKDKINDKPFVNIKENFENQIIEVAKFIFNKYPFINYLPFLYWGRYYKYECAGNFFLKTGFFEEINPDCNSKLELNNNYKCLTTKEEIDLLDEDDEISDLKDKIIFPYENEIIKFYGGNNKGGSLLFVDKDLKINIVRTDTPE